MMTQRLRKSSMYRFHDSVRHDRKYLIVALAAALILAAILELVGQYGCDLAHFAKPMRHARGADSPAIEGALRNLAEPLEPQAEIELIANFILRELAIAQLAERPGNVLFRLDRQNVQG